MNSNATNDQSAGIEGGRVKRFSAGLFCGLTISLALFPALLYLYLLTGLAPVTTSAAPLPLEHFLAKTALHAKMDKEFPRTVPMASNEATWLAGASIYRQNCAVCHGLPKQSPTSIGQGMFPKAPQLFVPENMVTDDPPGEIFWKAKNGIRLSGMPGFGRSLNDAPINYRPKHWK